MNKHDRFTFSDGASRRRDLAAWRRMADKPLPDTRYLHDAVMIVTALALAGVFGWFFTSLYVEALPIINTIATALAG